MVARLGNLRQFGLRELHAATDGFSPKNILGKGGFGNVYRGKLADGSTVAVKRLKDPASASGEAQFRTEVEMISLAVHRHLLRLVGFCAASGERILVYPYMPNGSVASRLRGTCVRSFRETVLSGTRIHEYEHQCSFEEICGSGPAGEGACDSHGGRSPGACVRRQAAIRRGRAPLYLLVAPRTGTRPQRKATTAHSRFGRIPAASRACRVHAVAAIPALHARPHQRDTKHKPARTATAQYRH